MRHTALVGAVGEGRFASGTALRGGALVAAAAVVVLGAVALALTQARSAPPVAGEAVAHPRPVSVPSVAGGALPVAVERAIELLGTLSVRCTPADGSEATLSCRGGDGFSAQLEVFGGRLARATFTAPGTRVRGDLVPAPLETLATAARVFAEHPRDQDALAKWVVSRAMALETASEDVFGGLRLSLTSVRGTTGSWQLVVEPTPRD